MRAEETENLSNKRCQPCEGTGQAFTHAQTAEYIKKVPGWQLRDDAKLIFREYLMKNFMAAVRLINNIAAIAESENHHPDIHLAGYRKLRVELSTHALGGLSENDFILASKINQLQPS